MLAKNRSKTESVSFRHDCKPDNTFGQDHCFANSKLLDSPSSSGTELYAFSPRPFHILHRSSRFCDFSLAEPAYLLSDIPQPKKWEQIKTRQLGCITAPPLIASSKPVRALTSSLSHFKSCPKTLQPFTYTFRLSATYLQAIQSPETK